MSANNAARAERARLTMEFYNGLVGETGDEARTFASDILADLLHYVDSSDEEIDLEGVCITAQANFDMEQEEEA